MSEISNQNRIIDKYYDYDYPTILGGSGNSVATSILRKWEKLECPNSFRMTNTELAKLAGVSPSNVGSLRARVIREVTIDEYPLFAYVSRGQRRAGIYYINIDETLNKHLTNIEQTLNRRSEQDIKEEEGNQIPLEADIDSEKEKEHWFFEILSKASPQWVNVNNVVNEFQVNTINEILEYPQERIEEVVTKAGQEGIRPNKILGWILKGLDKFDQLYRNGNIPIKSPTNVDLAIQARKSKVAGAMKAYHDYKTGKRPDDEGLPDESMYFKLSRLLPDVIEVEADLDFSVADYEAMLKLWEAKK